jgi:hypothetical protein
MRRALDPRQPLEARRLALTGNVVSLPLKGAH